ncbi:hypothetical protein V8J88_00100 [Massilia sp. W12]|uniref:hypothetical protein n=1 Tax=Massilia sp. W12 TaxID=3126507 RepID=UPI0030D4C2CE
MEIADQQHCAGKKPVPARKNPAKKTSQAARTAYNRTKEFAAASANSLPAAGSAAGYCPSVPPEGRHTTDASGSSVTRYYRNLEYNKAVRRGTCERLPEPTS